MKKFSLTLLLAINLFAAQPTINSTVEELSWPSGDTFLTFLEKNSIPLKLYYDLDSEDKEFVSEIKAGIAYQILRDEKGAIKQVLIPINEELQVQIYKDEEDKFKFQLASISYQTYKRVLSIPVSANPSQDILEATGSVALAHGFFLAMKGEVGDKEFKKLKKGDRIAMEYTQKIRLGRTFGMPEIHWASIQIGGKTYTVYKHKNKYYDKNGKKNDKFLLVRPISNARITSPFTPKRFHPILKRYKAHLGVDYGAPKGTPIKAAGEGTVKFVGTKSGYGKVVIIGHGGGYETLYAHTSGFAKGIKTGVKVKQGQLIAYVGSTGMSTGSHLHFGVYKNGNAINPETEIKVAKSVFASKENDEFKKIVRQLEPKIKEYINKDEIPEKERKFEAAMDWGHPLIELKSDENSTLKAEANLTDANLTTPKSDVNLTAPKVETNLTDKPKSDVNLTKTEANLTAAKTDENLSRSVKKEDVNLSSQANAKLDVNLTDANLTAKGEANLTAQPKAENNSSATKTDANETVNLAAAKSAKAEANSTAKKVGKAASKTASKTDKTKANSDAESAKTAKNGDKAKSATDKKDAKKRKASDDKTDKQKDKASSKAKAQSKKKNDAEKKDKPKKRKDANATAKQNAKSKTNKTSESSDAKSK